MKAKKKLPIFWEIIKSSFLIITLILTIYTIAQVIIFGLFTSDYEADLVMGTYTAINDLSSEIGKEVSEDDFYEHLTNLEQRASEERIRIYSHDKVYYQTQSDIWSNIKTSYRVAVMKTVCYWPWEIDFWNRKKSETNQICKNELNI